MKPCGFVPPFFGKKNGGERGIRTLGDLRLGGFQDRCLKPLDHLSGLANYFIEAFEALGGSVVFETFPEGTSDFAAYVSNARNQGAEVFFSPVSIEAAGLIIEQASTQGLSIPILAGDTWDSNVVLAAAKDTNVKIYVTTFFVEGSQEPQVLEFVDGFRNYINTNATAKTNNGGNDEISAVSAMGFDAYYVALEALKAAYARSLEEAKKAEMAPPPAPEGPLEDDPPEIDELDNLDDQEAYSKASEENLDSMEDIVNQKNTIIKPFVCYLFQ